MIYSTFHDDLTDTNEKESTVNLLHAAVFNQAFGYDLEDAFADSVGNMGNPYRRLDNTAVAWMCSFHFSFYDDPMINGEKAYQLKGHAKFIELAWSSDSNSLRCDVTAPLRKRTGVCADRDDRLHGQVVGVICHEHGGPPRVWTPDEVAFASQVADLVRDIIQANSCYCTRRSLS